jgi:outer membrane protein assembly factor BamB
MKAIVFTMDAIFALIVATASISVLVYFRYFSQVPYSPHYSNVEEVFSNLVSTSIDSMQNSSMLARAIALQSAGANETSPQFLGSSQRNSSNGIGPLEPILTYIYNPGNTITTGVVADYGNIYFAANNLVYAVNASTNRTVWTRNIINNVIVTPALYSGMLFFANLTNLTAVSARTGSISWSTNVLVSTGSNVLTSPLLVYDNEVIFGASDNNVHAFYANNGTAVWLSYIGSKPVSVTSVSGDLAVKTNTGVIDLVVQAGNAANILVTNQYPASIAPTNTLASNGNRIYFGSGTNAIAIYTNGIVVGNFPISSGYGITGISVYRNYVVYQNSVGVGAVSPTGSVYWGVTMPLSFGGALINATPVVSGSMVYTAWTNGIAAQNLTTGSILWFALLPNVKIFPSMTLAYGRLYVVANNEVFAYGACGVPAHSSVLSAAATMYFNSRSGCSSALLNIVYPPINYSIFTGNASVRKVQSASFNGVSSYIDAKNTNMLDTPYVSVSFWINISAYPASSTKLINYGDNNGGCLVIFNCGWLFSIDNTGLLQFSVMNIGQTTVNALPLSKNTWYFVTGAYNGTNVTLYVNGGTPYKAPRSGIIGSTSQNINLTIGRGRPGFDPNYFTGNIANVQIYSSPISKLQVSQMYLRGIGGVPLKNSGLVAWYPLGGDTNDYSGFDVGYGNAVKFVTQNYAPPSLMNAYDIARVGTILPIANFSNGVTNTIQVGVYSWS